MFRRLPTSLPKDLTAPTDLKDLGYFLNDNDQVRMIQRPDQKFQYRINRIDRVNDVYKEAVNSCVRNMVKQRLLDLGLEVIRVPLGAEPGENHIPIYVLKEIENKKRVLVVFGERNQELGIFSYRKMGENGIKIGSAQELVTALSEGQTSTKTDGIPGVIITNPGQLIWYQGEGRAIGYNEYLNVGRQSAVHAPFRIDPIRNSVPGNANYVDHVQYVFETVMTRIVSSEVKFDIIGLEYTGDAVVKYLADHWSVWRNRINGICLGNPQFKLKDLASESDKNMSFKQFLAKRVRAYFVSDKVVETPISGRDNFGCNCYASGEALYEDGILVEGWRSMLDWFNMISVLDNYEEPVFRMIDESGTEEDGDAKGVTEA